MQALRLAKYLDSAAQNYIRLKLAKALEAWISILQLSLVFYFTFNGRHPMTGRATISPRRIFFPSAQYSGPNELLFTVTVP